MQNHNIHQFLTNLPSKEIMVALLICNTSVSQDEWMNPLAQTLAQKGFSTVGIFVDAKPDGCSLDGAGATFIVPADKLAQLERINVFIISDMDLRLNFPASSKVLGCVHAFETAHDTAFHDRIQHISYLDGMMIPFPLTPKSRELTTKLWTGLAAREACSRKSDVFTFISASYPRLAAINQQLSEQNIAPDSIVYAPMTSSWNTEQGGQRIEKYGKSIIRTLLNAFPQMNVIFRPFKQDINTDAAQDARAHFAAESRFIFDDNPGRLFAFSRSAALVTDLSHIGQTFSFATLRPAIYYQPWRGKLNKTMDRCGNYHVYSMRDLVDAVGNCLEHADAHAQKLLELRNSATMPIENGFAAIAERVIDFYADREHPDMLRIRRFDAHKPVAAVEIVTNLLEVMESPVIAASATSLCRQHQSPLLLAFALHAGKKLMPETPLLNGVGQGALKFLGINREVAKYKDIEAGIIELLYAKAMQEYTRQRNVNGIHLTQYLLEELQKDFYKNSQ